jgi:hypothetical protein
MKATFRNETKTKAGQIQYIYNVLDATPEEIALLKEIKGEYYRDDKVTGQPLIYTFFYQGKNTTFLISKNNKIYADNSDIIRLSNLAANIGGLVGDKLAEQIASKLLGEETSRVTNHSNKSEPEDSGENLKGL